MAKVLVPANRIKEALIATTDNIRKYAELDCRKAYPIFAKEFNSGALNERPFVNFLAYGLNGDVLSIHDNYSVLDAVYYKTENTLDAMIKNYLDRGVLGTSIKFVKPPLIITDALSKDDVEKAFQRNGYAAFKEIPRTIA